MPWPVVSVGLFFFFFTLLDLDQERRHYFLTGQALEALVALLNDLVICFVTLTAI